jgi:hypothetical protein
MLNLKVSRTGRAMSSTATCEAGIPTISKDRNIPALKATTAGIVVLKTDPAMDRRTSEVTWAPKARNTDSSVATVLRTLAAT